MKIHMNALSKQAMEGTASAPLLDSVVAWEMVTLGDGYVSCTGVALVPHALCGFTTRKQYTRGISACAEYKELQRSLHVSEVNNAAHRRCDSDEKTSHTGVFYTGLPMPRLHTRMISNASSSAASQLPKTQTRAPTGILSTTATLFDHSYACATKNCDQRTVHTHIQVTPRVYKDAKCRFKM